MRYMRNASLQNARALRRSMTKEERHLWYDFLRYCTPRFRRQEIIGNYIADFFCQIAAFRLGIVGTDTQQNQKTLADAANHLTVDGDGGGVDSCLYCTHSILLWRDMRYEIRDMRYEI